MSMATYSVFLPSYTVGEDAYKAIPEVCGHFGTKAVVVGGKTAMSKAKDALLAGIAGSKIKITDFIWYGGDATFENVEKLKTDKRILDADMIFGVGGGRACDTAKPLADMLGKPLFTFPTLASNCASCTVYLCYV
jgi:glycerol dehydrogenase